MVCIITLPISTGRKAIPFRTIQTMSSALQNCVRRYVSTDSSSGFWFSNFLFSGTLWSDLEICGSRLAGCLTNIIALDCVSRRGTGMLGRREVGRLTLCSTGYLYAVTSKIMSGQVYELQAHISIYLFDTSHLTDITKLKTLFFWNRTQFSTPALSLPYLINDTFVHQPNYSTEKLRDQPWKFFPSFYSLHPIHQ